MNINESLFPFGQVVMTPGFEAQAADCLKTIVPELLQKHGQLDKGVLSPDDDLQNAVALKHGQRIFSAFLLHGQKIWIITEHDRSVTTLLMPDEY